MPEIQRIPLIVKEAVDRQVQTGKETLSRIKEPVVEKTKTAATVLGVGAGLAGITFFGFREGYENWNEWHDKQGQIEELPGWLRYGIDDPIANLNHAIGALDTPSTALVPDENGNLEWTASRFPNAAFARDQLTTAGEYFDGQTSTIANEIFSARDHLPDDEAVRVVDGKFVNEKTTVFDPNKAEIATAIDSIESLADSPEIAAAEDLKTAKTNDKFQTFFHPIVSGIGGDIVFVGGVGLMRKKIHDYRKRHKRGK